MPPREALADPWDVARRALMGLPGGGLNIGYEATTAQVRRGRGAAVALCAVGRDGAIDITRYDELDRLSNQVANALGSLGVGVGARVFLLLPRSRLLVAALLGGLKAGAVVSPLFTAFGPEPVRTRLRHGDATLVVTSTALYQRRIAPVRDQLPALRCVLLTDRGQGDVVAGTELWARAVDAASERFDPVHTSADDPALIHYTSGTTGQPKGAVHVHEAVVAHYSSAVAALDFREDDVFWCTADPGWVTGTSYGIIAPLVHGVTNVLDERGFDAERWYRVLQDQRVTVWYTAPTAVRMLMRAGPELRHRFDLSRLRFVATVGEPLGADAVVWGARVLGTPIHDTWWQSETGAIMIANQPGAPPRPGSMGTPLPGVEAVILATGRDGEVVERSGAPVVVAEPGITGHLALRRGWPSMFRGYLHDDERYRACFHGDWYVTGDLARRDGDGCFWFVGRTDDVIKSAGHMIGPFEVESVLMRHPAVMEAAVVGQPDQVAGAIVKAFVTVAPGFDPTDSLRRELIAYARRSLGPALAPREISFLAHLPKTTSGKTAHRLLRSVAPAEELEHR